MKNALRFVFVCLFVVGLSAQASKSVEAQREPVILDLYRAIHRGMTNLPVMVTATGFAMLVGFRTRADLSQNLITNGLLPIAGTFLATLLVGEYLVPTNENDSD